MPNGEVQNKESSAKTSRAHRYVLQELTLTMDKLKDQVRLIQLKELEDMEPHYSLCLRDIYNTRHDVVSFFALGLATILSQIH